MPGARYKADENLSVLPFQFGNLRLQISDLVAEGRRIIFGRQKPFRRCPVVFGQGQFYAEQINVEVIRPLPDAAFINPPGILNISAFQQRIEPVLIKTGMKLI